MYITPLSPYCCTDKTPGIRILRDGTTFAPGWTSKTSIGGGLVRHVFESRAKVHGCSQVPVREADIPWDINAKSIHTCTEVTLTSSALPVRRLQSSHLDCVNINGNHISNGTRTSGLQAVSAGQANTEDIWTQLGVDKKLEIKSIGAPTAPCLGKLRGSC
jgi:hypothetical protein